MGKNQNQPKTKQCKFCRSEIDKKAKVCPVCHRAQSKGKGCLIAAIVTIVVIVGIVLAIVIPIAVSVGSGEFNPSSASSGSANSQYITYAEYKKIQNGMTYDEVVSIIGSGGTELSSSGSGQFYTVIYMWYGDGITGANANVTFQNGVVIAKAQVGLK